MTCVHKFSPYMVFCGKFKGYGESPLEAKENIPYHIHLEVKPL